MLDRFLNYLDIGVQRVGGGSESVPVYQEDIMYKISDRRCGAALLSFPQRNSTIKVFPRFHLLCYIEICISHILE